MEKKGDKKPEEPKEPEKPAEAPAETPAAEPKKDEKKDDKKKSSSSHSHGKKEKTPTKDKKKCKLSAYWSIDIVKVLSPRHSISICFEAFNNRCVLFSVEYFISKGMARLLIDTNSLFVSFRIAEETRLVERQARRCQGKGRGWRYWSISTTCFNPA